MTDLEFRDLASAAGFAAVAYALFNILISFGSGRPVAEWINPHRRYLLSLAAVLLLGAGTLLLRGAQRHTTSAEALLTDLIHHERAKPEAVGAMSFGLFAGTLLALYFWCRWLYPRDPSTFSTDVTDLKAECRRAMRHYIRWSHQLDYAALFAVEGGKVEKQTCFHLAEKAIAARMGRVDCMQLAPGADPNKAVGAQLIRWDDLATRIFAAWGDLDKLVAPARQGVNALLVFDLEFGGVFVEQLQEFAAPSGERVRVFLFAVCLDQYGIDSSVAGRYYTFLARAVRHIRTGGCKVRG
ncbi:MAG TPA: hypothetical protein VH092_16325 [Urbifossiella sp.]|jgi:hypothetical protein|nr:hypothetical protein [Urbifossiella sp.]